MRSFNPRYTFNRLSHAIRRRPWFLFPLFFCSLYFLSSIGEDRQGRVDAILKRMNEELRGKFEKHVNNEIRQLKEMTMAMADADDSKSARRAAVSSVAWIEFAEGRDVIESTLQREGKSLKILNNYHEAERQFKKRFEEFRLRFPAEIQAAENRFQKTSD